MIWAKAFSVARPIPRETLSCFEIAAGVESDNSGGSLELTLRGSDVKAHLSVHHTSILHLQFNVSASGH